MIPGFYYHQYMYYFNVKLAINYRKNAFGGGKMLCKNSLGWTGFKLTQRNVYFFGCHFFSYKSHLRSDLCLATGAAYARTETFFCRNGEHSDCLCAFTPSWHQPAYSKNTHSTNYHHISEHRCYGPTLPSSVCVCTCVIVSTDEHHTWRMHV